MQLEDQNQVVFIEFPNTMQKKSNTSTGDNSQRLPSQPQLCLRKRTLSRIQFVVQTWINEKNYILKSEKDNLSKDVAKEICVLSKQRNQDVTKPWFIKKFKASPTIYSIRNSQI